MWSALSTAVGDISASLERTVKPEAGGARVNTDHVNLIEDICYVFQAQAQHPDLLDGYPCPTVHPNIFLNQDLSLAVLAPQEFQNLGPWCFRACIHGLEELVVNAGSWDASIWLIRGSPDDDWAREGRVHHPLNIVAFLGSHWLA